MVDVVLTRGGVAYAASDGATLDLAYGEDENDYELTLPDSISATVRQGDIWMIDGTPYGGVVDSIQSDKSNGATVVTYSGRSLQGILAAKILQPDKDKDYLTYDGTVSGLLALIVSRTDLNDLFEISDDGTRISVRFDRYTDAYTGIRKALAASSLKLAIRCELDRAILAAETMHDDADSGVADWTARREYRRTNHLIGLGKGELADRAVSHWYADANGNVSQKQTLTGLDEVAATYEYTNAEQQELDEKTREELTSRQEGNGSIDLTIREGREYDVGDLLSVQDDATGVSVRAAVTKKIVRIVDGVLSVDYEVGQSTASSGGRSESSGGSGGGGVSYTAGEGISIESNTISADVTKSDLERVEVIAGEANRAASDASAGVGELTEAMKSKADVGHKHSAADITSGTLSADRLPVVPVSKGGTGASDSGSARSNLGVANPLATPTKLTNQNLNDYTGDGKWGAYFAAGGNTVTNKPSGVGHFGLLVIRAADGVTWQMLHNPAANQVWVRSNDSGSWKAWVALVRSSDKIASASNADAAASATKATQDSAGQRIDATYVKAVTASGRTVTVTKGDGTTSQFTTQDTTYGAATQSASGLMSSADKKKLDGVASGANAYKLPPATTSALGGVKPDGKTITVSSDGTISAQQGGAAGFLAAHPVGSIYMTTKPGDPGSTYGGTWRELPSLGPHTWERTA